MNELEIKGILDTCKDIRRIIDENPDSGALDAVDNYVSVTIRKYEGNTE